MRTGSIQNRRWFPFALALMLAVLTIAIYWPTRGFDFLNWDDLTFIMRNDHLRGGFTWAGAKWFFTHSYSGNWAPFAWISHMLDVQFFGLNAGAHHMVNVVLHAINAVLLFFLLTALFRPQLSTLNSQLSSFLAASIFALHPLRVESVAWIAERRDVLSGFFFMLTLLCYAKYAQKTTEGRGIEQEITEGTERAGKSTECTEKPLQTTKYPPSSEALRRTGAKYAEREKPNAGRGMWYFLTFVTLACGLMSKPMLVTVPFVLLLLDFWPLGRMGVGTAAEGCRTPQVGATVQTPPSILGFSHSFGIRHSSLGIVFRLLAEKLPFLLLSLAASIITFWAQKQGGAVASLEKIPLWSRLENIPVAYCEYLLKFFWPANLSPLYPHRLHWESWQIAGSSLVLAALLVAAWTWRRRFPFMIVGLLWFLGMLVPVIGIVQVGSQAFADRYTYLPIIGITFTLVWFLCSITQRSTLSPQLILWPLIALLAWRTSAQLTYWRNTQTLFSRVLEITPDNVQALYSLGTDLIDAGKIDKGLPYLKRAIELQPSYPQALGTMGNLLDNQGNYAEAVRFYEAGLKADPNESGILNNLAWLRCACPDAMFRNGREAVRLATKACELTGYSKPIFIGTVAAAYAEDGQFELAISTAERAAALANSLNLPDTAQRNYLLIELYKQHKTVAQEK